MPETNAITSKVWQDRVKDERKQQEAKWGEQNHSANKWLGILDHEVAKLHIAVEKHPNSSHEVDKRIVQVASVCQAMWESGVRGEWL